MAEEFVTEALLASYLRETIPTGAAEVHVAGANAEIVEFYEDQGITPPTNPVPAKVQNVALEVAARGYRNPAALTSETRTSDDFTITKRREGKNAQTPGIYLTKADERKLLRAVGKLTGKTFGTIALRVGPLQ